jgi:hypothetical protein
MKRDGLSQRRSAIQDQEAAGRASRNRETGALPLLKIKKWSAAPPKIERLHLSSTRGGWENGHRTFKTGFRTSASGLRLFVFTSSAIYFIFLCLREWHRSPLAWRPPASTASLFCPLNLFRFRGTGEKPPWDCKVTPAYCACQEGNTIGCIFNNDRLDSGLADSFSTRTIHGAFTNSAGAKARIHSLAYAALKRRSSAVLREFG